MAEALRATPVKNLTHCLSSQNFSKICFVKINKFHEIPWPFTLYKDDYHEDNPYYSRLGYRKMCRFWSKTLFLQPFMQNVSSYMRIDTDLFLQKMPIDPFSILKTEKLAYLSTVYYKENKRQTEGLWETFLRFAVQHDIHPKGLIPLSNQNKITSNSNIQNMTTEQAANVLYERGYNLDYIYNNWEVSIVSIWQSEIYSQLIEFVDKTGGIFMRRWGDAPIRTLSLHLLKDNTKSFHQIVFKQYPGLQYFHKAVHATLTP